MLPPGRPGSRKRCSPISASRSYEPCAHPGEQRGAAGQDDAAVQLLPDVDVALGDRLQHHACQGRCAVLYAPSVTALRRAAYDGSNSETSTLLLVPQQRGADKTGIVRCMQHRWKQFASSSLWTPDRALPSYVFTVSSPLYDDNRLCAQQERKRHHHPHQPSFSSSTHCHWGHERLPQDADRHLRTTTDTAFNGLNWPA